MFQSSWMEIFPWIKLSWHSCSLWDTLSWINWFWQFLCEGLSSFNAKRFYYSYAWSCSLCERRTSFCTGLITRKLCRFLCFRQALLHLVFCFFFLYQSLSPSLSLCTVFDSISSNIDEILSIHTSTICLFLKTS